MGRTCFISFKREDKEYKRIIQEDLKINMIDKSLDDAIDSDDVEYVMKKIREDYLSDSTVTIHLIGAFSSESLGEKEQIYIKRELQASLFNGKGNTRSGILGVVLPSATSKVYRGQYDCTTCGKSHNWISVADTTVKEFSYNYYIPNDKCSHSDDDRYCVLVKWEDFKQEPEKYIEQAFAKREHPIAEKIKVRP